MTRGVQGMDRELVILLVADLVVLLAVVATALEPAMRELRLLRLTIRQALARRRTIRAELRRRLLEQELERQVQLAEMVPLPQLLPLPQLTTRAS
jgi:hypothetical protein